MKHTKASEESIPAFLFRLAWSTVVGILFVIPSFTILYVLNDILRTWTNKRLKMKYGPKTHVLEEGGDAVWLYKVQNGKRQILYLAINEEPMDLERHRQNYMEKVLSKPEYQKLMQIFTEDFGYNIQKLDMRFDIRNHVRIMEGTEERVVTEEELMDHVLPQLSEEMDDSKPQWEDVIIPRFKYDKEDEKVRSARIFRVHHAYMDGGSNLLMIADTQYEGEGEFPFVVDPTKPPNIALWKRALYKFNCLLLFGWVVLYGLYAPSSKVVRNRFRTPKLSGQTNYAWSKPIPMDLLKEIKNTSRESMPTILMSVLGGAIRKLNEKFPAKGGVERGVEESDEITVGMVAGAFPYPDYKLKNRHAIFHMKVDVGEKSPINRLESTSGTMQKVILFGRTPIWFSDACMRVMGFPLVLSNIPVAQKRVKLWENEVMDIGGWPPMLSICGIGFVTIRYGDTLRVCVNSDKAAISKEELNFLMSQIAEEVQLLSEGVKAAAIAAAAAAAAKKEEDEKEQEVEEQVPAEVAKMSERRRSSLIHRHFERSFLYQHSANGNNMSNHLKFRLNASFNTIKDSLSKFREP